MKTETSENFFPISSTTTSFFKGVKSYNFFDEDLLNSILNIEKLDKDQKF